MTLHKLFSIIPYKGQLLKLENAISANAYYRHQRIDLLTGKSFSCDFNDWIEESQGILLNSLFDHPRVIHLFYELGFLIEKKLELLNPDALLVIDIQFEKIEEISGQSFSPIHLEALSVPDLQDYKRSFEIGFQQLLMGNCYQFNLTYPYLFSFEKHLKPEDFIFSLWREVVSRGAFGSATYIPFYKKLFLSNSPECLFQYKENTLSTMPIKGTFKRKDSEDWRALWQILANDKKSQAELYMISDLLRNDLARIESPSAKIVKNKCPKLVPGLLHQYSQVEVELSAAVNLWRVIEKVFPGGSITGAPKKRAIKLINELEKRERGFYSGSTLILYKAMKSASINIRSSIIDFDNFTLLYQAGGGITLMSDAQDEYQEMTYKLDSFIRTLTI